jgi:hypothetical protein
MPNTGSSSMRLRIWSNPLRRTSRSDVQDWKVQVVLVAACKTDSRKATNNLEGDTHENEFHSAGDGFAGSGDPRSRADEPTAGYSGASYAGSIHPGTCGEAYEGKDNGPQEDGKGQARKGEACGAS